MSDIKYYKWNGKELPESWREDIKKIIKKGIFSATKKEDSFYQFDNPKMALSKHDIDNYFKEIIKEIKEKKDDDCFIVINALNDEFIGTANNLEELNCLVYDYSHLINFFDETNYIIIKGKKVKLDINLKIK